MTTPAPIPASTPALVVTTWTITIYDGRGRSVYRVQRLAPHPYHQEEDEHADR